MADLPHQRRHPLQKERFLEGNRQKFTIILLAAMFLVMVGEVNWHVNAQSYLSFLTFIGSFFLGGATVSAWVAANKSDTVNQNVTTVQTSNKNDTVNVQVKTAKDDTINQNINQTVSETKKVEIDLNQYIKEEGVNGPAMRPFSMMALGDDEEGEYHDDFIR